MASAVRHGGRLAPEPAGGPEVEEHQRLPPGQARTELRWTPASAPEPHRKCDALKVERCNRALPKLPTNADQDQPTPSGPTDLKKLSHTFLLRELLQGGRAAWQRWTRRRTHDARQPEGVNSTGIAFRRSELALYVGRVAFVGGVGKRIALLMI